MEKCGLRVDPASLGPAEDLRVVVITAPDALTNQQIRCAATVSVKTRYFLDLPKTAIASYNPVYDEVSADASAADAKRWLASHGRLKDLPPYSEGQDEAFASAVETFCGPEVKGALQSRFGPHSINPEWAGKLEAFSPSQLAQFECLLKAAAARRFAIDIIGLAAQR